MGPLVKRADHVSYMVAYEPTVERAKCHRPHRQKQRMALDTVYMYNMIHMQCPFRYADRFWALCEPLSNVCASMRNCTLLHGRLHDAELTPNGLPGSDRRAGRITDIIALSHR